MFFHYPTTVRTCTYVQLTYIDPPMWPTILKYNWSNKINISLNGDQLDLSCYHKIQQSEVHHMASLREFEHRVNPYQPI